MTARATGGAARRAAAGPIGECLCAQGVQVKARDRALRAGANPLIVLHRAAFVVRNAKSDDQAPATGSHRAEPAGKKIEFDTEAEAAVLHWAAECGLGQESELVERIARRRAAAVAALVQQSGGGYEHRRLIVHPLWRMAVGLGDRLNPYEIGLALHGTYGCPVIPGSTLKGLTRAWASGQPIDEGDPKKAERIFGAAPENNESAAGSVRFLDALPAGKPVTVARDVVTPHVGPYYGQGDPPGEYHNPVPSAFLVVSGGEFAIDLIGPPADVAAAAEWCETAVDELGVGGKTAAGYGYLTTDRRKTA